MKKLIQFLLSGCWHEWEIIKERDLVDERGAVIGVAYNLKCKKCGDMKRKTLVSHVWSID